MQLYILNPLTRRQKIKEVVAKQATIEGVKEVHEVSANWVSGKLYITLHAYVNPELSVEEAHVIAETIEQKIKVEIKPLENITVHVEPAGETVPADQFSENKLQKFVSDTANKSMATWRLRKS